MVSLEVLTSHYRSNLPLCIQALRNLHCDSIGIQVQVPKLCNLSRQHHLPFLRPSLKLESTRFEENREPCVYSMNPCQRANGSSGVCFVMLTSPKFWSQLGSLFTFLCFTGRALLKPHSQVIRSRATMARLG